MMRENTDVLIAGGGIAGLVATAAFGLSGFRVICVDPAPRAVAPTHGAADLRTTAFLQPARAFLDRLGLWEALEAQATPLQVMRIVDAGREKPVIRDFVAADISDQPFGWNLPNSLLGRVLTDRIAALPNVSFRPGSGFAGLLAREKTALVTLSDGSQVSAALVIGADGRASAVRDAASITARTTRTGQKALVFAVTHVAPHDNISTEIHRAGGPFTLVPLPDHEGKPCSSVVWMEQGPTIARLAALPDPAFAQEATERSAGLYGPLTLVGPRQTWPIISQIAGRMSARRVALMAEAAHVLPPIGAQGLNMSLADLACLLDLAQARPLGLGDSQMLDRYHQQRHPATLLRVGGIAALNLASLSGSPLARTLRSLGLRALHDIAPVRRNIMQLGLGARAPGR